VPILLEVNFQNYKYANFLIGVIFVTSSRKLFLAGVTLKAIAEQASLRLKTSLRGDKVF
jgi:hypothetical protein